MKTTDISCGTDLQSHFEERSVPFVPSFLWHGTTLRSGRISLRSSISRPCRVCKRCVLVCRIVAITLGRFRSMEQQPSRWRHPLGGMGGHFCGSVPIIFSNECNRHRFVAFRLNLITARYPVTLSASFRKHENISKPYS